MKLWCFLFILFLAVATDAGQEGPEGRKIRVQVSSLIAAGDINAAQRLFQKSVAAGIIDDTPKTLEEVARREQLRALQDVRDLIIDKKFTEAAALLTKATPNGALAFYEVVLVLTFIRSGLKLKSGAPVVTVALEVLSRTNIPDRDFLHLKKLYREGDPWFSAKINAEVDRRFFCREVLTTQEVDTPTE